jgi:hypothetical protein
MALLGKSIYSGGGMVTDVKPEHRLSPSATPPSAATCWCPKGQRAGR